PLGTMPDHHVDTVRQQCPRTVNDMLQHRLALHRMKYLGTCGTHAGALSGGMHDNVEIHQNGSCRVENESDDRSCTLRAASSGVRVAALGLSSPGNTRR